jgi:hypothetical protein
MVTSRRGNFREAVADAVRRDVIPDSVWDRCEDWVERDRFFDKSTTARERSAIVSRAARCVQMKFDEARDIVAYLDRQGSAERRVVAREVQPRGRHVTSEPVTVTLSAYEQDRAWAFSLEVASLADAAFGQRIQRFRDRKLGGQFVSADGAEAWLRSPENRALAEELAREGEFLARFLPAWTPDEAAFYVLTRTPPPIHPLRGSFTRAHLVWKQHQRGVVSIEVEPWVSEKSVTRLYRDVRARVLSRHDPCPRSMAVWRFVESLHVNPRPTLRDVWREFYARARAQRPVRPVRTNEVWRKWRAAHPEISSVTLAECHRRWNAKHADAARQRFRYYEKFRDALWFGVKHANTIAWPGYAMLSEERAGNEPSTPIATPKPPDAPERP